MEFKARTLRQLADMICGNGEADQCHFNYRSSSFITEFFQDCDTDFVHDGSTRWAWVAATLVAILQEPHPNAQTPPAAFSRVIQRLMDQGDSRNDDIQRNTALSMLNVALSREGFEAFYAEDKQCYLRHIKTNTIAVDHPNPHRPFSAAELKRREQLTAYLDTASEDELIEDVLLPLFRQMGFHRVTAAGHKDKALEGRVDEVHAADAARPLLRHPSEEGKAGRRRHDQEQQRQHSRNL